MADQTSQSRSSPPTRPRVLLIDDDNDSREMYELALRYHGLVVLSAPNARDALRLASETRPDIIVTDVTLPDMDGYELLRRLREEHGNAVPPFMVLTGWTGKEHEERARNAGCVKVLTKPCPPEDLLAEILMTIPSDGPSPHSAPA